MGTVSHAAPHGKAHRTPRWERSRRAALLARTAWRNTDSPYLQAASRRMYTILCDDPISVTFPA